GSHWALSLEHCALNLRLWLDQPEIAVGPPKEHGHCVVQRVPEHDHGVVAVAQLRGGILDRPRFRGAAANAHDAGQPPGAIALGTPSRFTEATSAAVRT